MNMTRRKLEEFAEAALHTEFSTMHRDLAPESMDELAIVLSHTREKVSFEWKNGFICVHTEHGRYDFISSGDDLDFAYLTVDQVL